MNSERYVKEEYFHNFTQIDKNYIHHLKNIVCTIQNYVPSSKNNNYNNTIIIGAHYGCRTTNSSRNTLILV